MRQTQLRVALTGGGSGGHIVPLLSLAHELKRLSPDCQIVYIGHKGDNFDSLRLPKHDFNFLVFINAGKFRRYHGESFFSHLIDLKTIILNVRDFFRVLRSVGSAYRILSKTGTNVLFAKGGFVSVPVGLAARLKGIPIVTHDSDTVGGLANRIIGRWATVRATGMPVDLYKPGKARVEYVGIPLDSKIQPVSPSQMAVYKKEIGLAAEDKVLLIAGGGLGSQNLNNKILTAAPQLLEAFSNLKIVHITGQQHLQTTMSAYAKSLDESLRRGVVCLGFTPDFYRYSGAADLIVSRAGATAIAEFAMQAKACIIVPSPFLAGGHQLKNAEVLKKSEAAVVLAEEEPAAELVSVITHLLNDSVVRHTLANNIAKLAKPGAAEKLARIIEQLNER